jgi:hypothetical protein
VKLEDLAIVFKRLWRREKSADKAKKKVGTLLKAAMLAAGVTLVPAGRAFVTFDGGASKQPTKADITAFFGAEQAEKFWKQLAARTSMYLTVVESVKKEKRCG